MSRATRDHVICHDGRVVPVPSGVYVHNRPGGEPVGVLALAAALVTEPMPGVVLVHLAPGAERAVVVLRYLGGLPPRVLDLVRVKVAQDVLDRADAGEVEELGDLYGTALVLPLLPWLRASPRAVVVDRFGAESSWDDDAAATVMLLTRMQAAERDSLSEAVRVVASGRAASVQRLQDWSARAADVRDEFGLQTGTAGPFTAGTVQHAFGAWLARFASPEMVPSDPPATVGQLGAVVGGDFVPVPEGVSSAVRLVAGSAVLVSFSQTGSQPDATVWAFADEDGWVSVEPKPEDVFAGTAEVVGQWWDAVLADSSTRVMAVDASGAPVTLARILAPEPDSADEPAVGPVSRHALADTDVVDPVWGSSLSDAVAARSQTVFMGSAPVGGFEGVVGAVVGADGVAVARLVGELRDLVLRWEGVLGVVVGEGGLPGQWNRFVQAVIEVDPADRGSVVGAVGALGFALDAVREWVPWLVLPGLDHVVLSALGRVVSGDRGFDPGGVGGDRSWDLRVGVLVTQDGRRLHGGDEVDFEPSLAGLGQDEREFLAGMAEQGDEFDLSLMGIEVGQGRPVQDSAGQGVAPGTAELVRWRADYSRQKNANAQARDLGHPEDVRPLPPPSSRAVYEWVISTGRPRKKTFSARYVNAAHLKAFGAAEGLEQQIALKPSASGGAPTVQFTMNALERFVSDLATYRSRSGAGDYPGPSEIPREAVSLALAFLPNDQGKIGRPHRYPSMLSRFDVEAFLPYVGLDLQSVHIHMSAKARIDRIGLGPIVFLASGDQGAQGRVGRERQRQGLLQTEYVTYQEWKTAYDIYRADPANHPEPIATGAIVIQWVQDHFNLGLKPHISTISGTRLVAFLRAHEMAETDYELVKKPGGGVVIGIRRTVGSAGRDGGLPGPVVGTKRAAGATREGTRKQPKIRKRHVNTRDLERFAAWLAPIRAQLQSLDEPAGLGMPLEEPRDVPLAAVSEALARGLLLNDTGTGVRGYRSPSLLRRSDVRAFFRHMRLDSRPDNVAVVVGKRGGVESILVRRISFLPFEVAQRPTTQPQGSPTQAGIESVSETSGAGHDLDDSALYADWWDEDLLDPALFDPALFDPGVLDPDYFHGVDAASDSSVEGKRGLEWDPRDDPQAFVAGEGVPVPSASADLGGDDVGRIGGVDGGVGTDVFLVSSLVGMPGSVRAAVGLVMKVSGQELVKFASLLRARVVGSGDVVSSRVGVAAVGKELWGPWVGGVTDVGVGASLSEASVDSLREQVGQMLAGYDFARAGVMESGGSGGVGLVELEALFPPVDVLVADLLAAEGSAVRATGPVPEQASGLVAGQEPVVGVSAGSGVAAHHLVSAPEGTAWVGRVLPLGVVSENRVGEVGRWADGLVRAVVLVGVGGTDVESEAVVADLTRVLRRFAYEGVQPVVLVLDKTKLDGLRDEFTPVVIERVSVGMDDRWSLSGADGWMVHSVTALTGALFDLADGLPSVPSGYQLPSVLLDWLAVSDPPAIERYLREHLAELRSPSVVAQMDVVAFEDAGVHRTVLNLLHRHRDAADPVGTRFVPGHSGSRSVIAPVQVRGPVPVTFVIDYLSPQRTLEQRKAWNDQLVQLVDVRTPRQIARTGIRGLDVEEMLALAVNTRDQISGELDTHFSRGMATVFSRLAEVLRMSQQTAAGPITTTSRWQNLIMPIATCDLSPAARYIVIHQACALRNRLIATGRNEHAALVRLVTDSISKCN